MENLLKYLCEQITGNDTISIVVEESEGIITYTIHAPKEVMGLLIGKGGKTIRAIRSLCKARAIIDQTRISVQLSEIE